MPQHTEHARFVNALRACIGLDPLYHEEPVPVEPPRYGAPHDDGNRRAPRAATNGGYGATAGLARSFHVLMGGGSARRGIRGFGR